MAIRLTDGQRWNTLYRLRRARKWDYYRLARELGYSYQHVRDVEVGRQRVTEQFIDRACAVFGIADSWELEQTVPAGQMSTSAGNLRKPVAS